MRSLPSALHTHPIPPSWENWRGWGFLPDYKCWGISPSARNGRWRDVRKINGIATGIPNEKFPSPAGFRVHHLLRRYLHHYPRTKLSDRFGAEKNLEYLILTILFLNPIILDILFPLLHT
jgi:hypothetical protein